MIIFLSLLLCPRAAQNESWTDSEEQPSVSAPLEKGYAQLRDVEVYGKGGIVDLSRDCLLHSVEDGAFFWAPSAVALESLGVPNVNADSGLFWAIQEAAGPVYLDMDSGRLLSVQEVRELELRAGSTPIDENSKVEEEDDSGLVTGPEAAASPLVDTPVQPPIEEPMYPPASPEQVGEPSSQADPVPESEQSPTCNRATEPVAVEAIPSGRREGEGGGVAFRNKFSLLERDEETEAPVDGDEHGERESPLPDASVLPEGKSGQASKAASSSVQPSVSAPSKSRRGKKWSLNRQFEQSLELAKSLSISVSRPSPTEGVRLPSLASLDRKTRFMQGEGVILEVPSVLKLDRHGTSKATILDPLAGTSAIFEMVRADLFPAVDKTKADPSLLFAFSLKAGIASRVGKQKKYEGGKHVAMKGFVTDRTLLYTRWDERVTRALISEADPGAGLESVGFLVTPELPESQLVNLMANMDGQVTVAVRKTAVGPEEDGNDSGNLLYGTGAFEALLSTENLNTDPVKAAQLIRQVSLTAPGKAAWVVRTSMVPLVMRLEPTPSGVLRVVYVGEASEESVVKAYADDYDGSQFYTSLPDMHFKAVNGAVMEKGLTGKTRRGG